ncbi:hypothetical protein [Porphyrobacter sp. YT40]|uniref:hypothetical protein n=1 Tax=Porphyrobacter sp. YT40 TaxID=2547601 RepID=UPI0011431AFA|nr:hypothetical protein [Porphyrobacter sp. YT40]QDH33869.1 hypothetical protein E2E27_05675 [Porphyrobacter sp. YT40]
MLRKPLTTTHPHGYVLARKDRALGLLRISKNASTESKNRLECADWLAFDDYQGPVVAFLREPVSRFLSSVPETALRMTHFAIAEEWRQDRVVIEEDIHYELMRLAQAPIATVMEAFVELVAYDFFDAHHEPQHAFFTDRNMGLRIDPHLYLTESFETAVRQIEARCGIRTPAPAGRGNEGGAKPRTGRTPLIDLARKVTRTGVYRTVAHAGFLGQRYRGDAGPAQLRDLNTMANQFAREIKTYALPDALRERILAIYALDQQLWAEVTARGGDIAGSAVWPGIATEGAAPVSAAARSA